MRNILSFIVFLFCFCLHLTLLGSSDYLEKDGRYLIYNKTALIRKSTQFSDCNTLMNEIISLSEWKDIPSCIMEEKNKKFSRCPGIYLTIFLPNMKFRHPDTKTGIPLFWQYSYNVIYPEYVEQLKQDFLKEKDVNLEDIIVLSDFETFKTEISWKIIKKRDNPDIEILKKFFEKYDSSYKGVSIDERGVMSMKYHMDRCSFELGDYVVQGEAKVEVPVSGKVSDDIVKKLDQIHEKMQSLKVVNNSLRFVVLGAYAGQNFSDLIQKNKESLMAIYHSLFYGDGESVYTQLKWYVDLDAFRHYMKIEQDNVIFNVTLDSVL